MLFVGSGTGNALNNRLIGNEYWQHAQTAAQATTH